MKLKSTLLVSETREALVAASRRKRIAAERADHSEAAMRLADSEEPTYLNRNANAIAHINYVADYDHFLIAVKEYETAAAAYNSACDAEAKEAHAMGINQEL